MSISPSFTLLLLIVTTVLSISSYSFSRGAVSNSPKRRHRKLNKIESLILIPFAAGYHLLILKALANQTFGDIPSCFLSTWAELLTGKNLFIDFVLRFFPEVNQCLETTPAEFFLSALFYYIVIVIICPYVMGKILYRDVWFKSSYNNLILFYEYSKFILSRTKTKFLLPATFFLIFYGSLLVLYLVGYEYLTISLLILSVLILFHPKLRPRLVLRGVAVFLTGLALVFYLVEVVFFTFSLLLLLLSLGLIEILKSWISSNDIPEYLKDFGDQDFFYIIDATLEGGKMVSGILRDFEYISEQKTLESIVLEKPVRWERFNTTEETKDFLDRKILREGYYLKEKSIPGESFYIRTSSLTDLNAAKTPRNLIFFFETQNPGPDASMTKEFERHFKKWFKDNTQKKYIFSNIDIYIASSISHLSSNIRDLFPHQKNVLGRLEIYKVEDEKVRLFLKNSGLRKSKQFIIECNMDKCLITSPYFEKQKADPSFFWQILFNTKFID